jgi:hypothetical protein
VQAIGRAVAPRCPDSSRTGSTPSSSATSCRAVSWPCTAANAATTSCWLSAASAVAPNAKLRALGAVPHGPAQEDQATEVAAAALPARPRPCRAGRRESAGHDCSSAFWLRHDLSTRSSAPKLRLDIDMQRCPSRGAGEFEVIAAILERPVIETILRPLGVRADVDSPATARAGERRSRRPKPRRARRCRAPRRHDAADIRGPLGRRLWMRPVRRSRGPADPAQCSGTGARIEALRTGLGAVIALAAPCRGRLNPLCSMQVWRATWASNGRSRCAFVPTE